MAIRTHLIPEVVLCAWMGLSAIKTSDKQVSVWMVTQVQAVLQFLGLQVSLNDSFWTPATWEVAL